MYPAYVSKNSSEHKKQVKMERDATLSLKDAKLRLKDDDGIILQ